MSQSGLQIPKSSVKRIMKINEDVNAISQDAVVAMCKVTELFLQKIAEQSYRECTKSGRKSVKIDDILSIISDDDSRDQMEFLEGTCAQRSHCQTGAAMQASTFVDECISGTTGGLLGMSLVYPLDTVKCRLQTHPHYTSPLHVCREMIAADGVKALYRGMASPAAGFGITYAFSFSGYGFAVRWIKQREGIAEAAPLSYAQMTAAGAFAGVVQAPARQIFERVKAVMQIREKAGGLKPYSWSGECFVQLVRTEGVVNGLFRGMTATFLREVPQFAVYYPVYESCKRAFAKNTNTPVDQLHPGYLMISGGIAGTMHWMPPIFCIDVIKSRMQSALPGVYKNTWDCIVKTYRTGGVRAFFKGLDIAIIRAFPLHGLVFVGYETTMAALKDRRLRRTTKITF